MAEIKSFELSALEEKKSTADAKKMDDEELAEYVVKTGGPVLRKLAELKPYLAELWRRFDQQGRKGPIYGCKTKAEFCQLHLHRSMRAVQYLLNGRPNGGKNDANNVRSGHKSGTRYPNRTFQWSYKVPNKEYEQLMEAAEVLGEDLIKGLILYVAARVKANKAKEQADAAETEASYEETAQTHRAAAAA